MSRADRRIPSPPRVAGALKRAAVDLYYNSSRLVVANLAFGVTFLVFLMAITWGSLGWLMAVALIPPTAGVMRLATSLYREGHVVLSDFIAEVCRPWRSLAVGSVQLLVAVVLVVDIAISPSMPAPLGALLAISAMYGLVIWWVFALTLWPLLLDPVRRGEPLAATVRLAATLLIHHPLRMLAFGAIVGLLLVVSVVAVAAIVTVSLAYAWLAAAHYVLPAADRLEGRETISVPSD